MRQSRERRRPNYHSVNISKQVLSATPSVGRNPRGIKNLLRATVVSNLMSLQHWSAQLRWHASDVRRCGHVGSPLSIFERTSVWRPDWCRGAFAGGARRANLAARDFGRGWPARGGRHVLGRGFGWRSLPRVRRCAANPGLRYATSSALGEAAAGTDRALARRQWRPAPTLCEVWPRPYEFQHAPRGRGHGTRTLTPTLSCGEREQVTWLRGRGLSRGDPPAEPGAETGSSARPGIGEASAARAAAVGSGTALATARAAGAVPYWDAPDGEVGGGDGAVEVGVAGDEACRGRRAEVALPVEEVGAVDVAVDVEVGGVFAAARRATPSRRRRRPARRGYR